MGNRKDKKPVIIDAEDQAPAFSISIDSESNSELQRELASHEYSYGKLGLITGLLCALAGVALFVNGIVGASNWTAKVLGAESTITDAAPGTVLLFVGLLVIAITRPKFKHR